MKRGKRQPYRYTAFSRQIRILPLSVSNGRYEYLFFLLINDIENFVRIYAGPDAVTRIFLPYRGNLRHMLNQVCKQRKCMSQFAGDQRIFCPHIFHYFSNMGRRCFAPDSAVRQLSSTSERKKAFASLAVSTLPALRSASLRASCAFTSLTHAVYSSMLSKISPSSPMTRA